MFQNTSIKGKRPPFFTFFFTSDSVKRFVFIMHLVFFSVAEKLCLLFLYVVFYEDYGISFLCHLIALR